MEITIIAPVYNEEACLPEFIKRITNIMNVLSAKNCNPRLLLVNDGSTDRSLAILQSAQLHDSRIDVLSLSGNFGHQTAVWCGLENVRNNNYVIVMDCDLQDPPEIIPEIVTNLSKFDIVLLQRISRKDRFLKILLANIYYKILNFLSDYKLLANSGDFYALSPLALKSLLLHQERVKYIRGLISNIGYPTTIMGFHRQSRFAGKTHYTFKKMLQLAIAGVTGFSMKPLLLISYFALFASVISALGAILMIFLKFYIPSDFSPGIATIIMIQLLLGVLILVALGIMSIYLARITLEVKNRPLYFLKNDKEVEK